MCIQIIDNILRDKTYLNLLFWTSCESKVEEICNEFNNLYMNFYIYLSSK